MEGSKIIKWSAIGLLCMVVSGSVCLNIYQYKKFKQLSLEADSPSAVKDEPVIDVPETTVQETAVVEIPAVGQEEATSDNIYDLKAQYAAIEEELDKANKQLSDKKAKEAEKKQKEKELQKLYMSSFLDSQYADLFKELNLSPEKLEKLKDIFVDKNMAMRETQSGTDMTREATQEEKAAIKQRTDKVKEEYEKKFKELLGDTNYEKYTAYTERSGSRAQVTNFKQTLSSDETLTKEQEKGLTEIMYNEQEKAVNEIVRNQPKEPAPGRNENSMAEQLKSTEKIHSKMIESAKDTLSSSQLEAFSEYLKNQREMMEISYSVQMSIEKSAQDN